MTKKQFGIIFTLLGLIVCTAVLAAKLNKGGLNDPSDLTTALSIQETGEEEKGEEKETVNQSSDFFYETRSIREQRDAGYIENFKSIASSSSATAEQKANANEEIAKITKIQDKQKTIETNIKAKGFEDALCEITENNKVNVVVKSQNELTQKDTVEIEEIVYNASGLHDITIEMKK